MRLVSFILMVVLALSALGPGSAIVFAPSEENHDVLEALDVCHRSASALTTGGEMPCMHSWPCHTAPVLSFSIGTHCPPCFSESIVLALNDQPPEDLL